MRTTVLQSYRTKDVPTWISTCLSSVAQWAQSQGWTYTFMDDALFDLVPGPICAKFADQKPLLADIGRLIWARQMFESDPTVERIVWLDADVLVFAPDHMLLPADGDFAVGRQIWVQPDAKDKLRVYRQVHNASLSINRGAPALDFLIQTMLSLADRHNGPASPQLLGPKLLTALHNIVRFAVIDSVGMASPMVLRDIADGGGPAYNLLKQESPAPLGALNLCASYVGRHIDELDCDEALFSSVIDAL